MATIEPKSRLPLSGEERVVLRGVSWQTYETLRDIASNSHLRMAYDEGTLELMSPSDDHEWLKRLIGQMIEAFTEELSIPRRSFSATTWKRRTPDKGLEADECYYILSHPKVRSRRRIDLAVDPPPDLALEIDLRPGEVQKSLIYAALGVPEIWRWEDDVLQAYSLESSGQYLPREFSLNLPKLRVADLEQFIDFEQASDESAWIKVFRAWVRERFCAAE
ncbi:MAG TPA: Uma2 family endonuclease [Pirellulales bacterium]|nr:Uma2 family endonuclease [Pirellulales bacterium]